MVFCCIANKQAQERERRAPNLAYGRLEANRPDRADTPNNNLIAPPPYQPPPAFLVPGGMTASEEN